MSLKPGIGKDFMHEVASQLMTYDLDEKLADVPNVLRHASVGKKMPLGRYLRGNLREMIGKDKNATEAGLQEYLSEMRALQDAARVDTEAPTLKAQILKRYGQKIASLEAKSKIFKQRSSL